MHIRTVTRIIFMPILIIVFTYASVYSASADKQVYRVEDKPYDELNKMEILANEARTLYWKGQYNEALAIFDSLTKTNHPSTPLYFNEIAQCQLALNDQGNAERSLLNVDNFFQAYNTADREKKALSSLGKEASKIYMGDPYERASNYLLLTLIFMSKGDYDNALAACKSAMLADSDAADNKMNSDYTLLHLLELKILQLIGKDDTALQSREAAKVSYINTHPSVRDLVADKLEKQELLGMSQEQRIKLGIKESQDDIKTKLAEIEDNITSISERINPENDLGVLLTGDYNTLIIVPNGKGPTKSRRGKDGQIVTVDTDRTAYRPASVLINDSISSVNPLLSIADVNYHSVTRCGRKMDTILNGKAVNRATTVGAGDFMTQLGNQMGGYVGLAMVVVGVVAQGVGGAMSPEADTRCWQSLPARYDIYALNLPPGENEVSVDNYIYFENAGRMKKKVLINGTKDMVVVIAPPIPVGRYSEIVESGTDKAKTSSPNNVEKGKVVLLLTPPLGLRKIDRFPPAEEREKPEAIAPDWRRVTKRLEKRLENPQIRLEKVGHSEILKNNDELSKSCPWAFQAEVEKLDLKKEKDDKIYSVQVTFSVINTASGAACNKETVTGMFRKVKNDKTSSTDAYYKCFDDALDQFFVKKSITDMINSKAQGASLQSL